jgi:hypothetical protein
MKITIPKAKVIQLNLETGNNNPDYVEKLGKFLQIAKNLGAGSELQGDNLVVDIKEESLVSWAAVQLVRKHGGSVSPKAFYVKIDAANVEDNVAAGLPNAVDGEDNVNTWMNWFGANQHPRVDADGNIAFATKPHGSAFLSITDVALLIAAPGVTMLTRDEMIAFKHHVEKKD